MNLAKIQDLKTMKHFRKVVVLLVIVSLIAVSTFGYAEITKPKTYTITEDEQRALTQAYSRKQITQQRLEQQKRLAESILTILQSNIKDAETEDQNAGMAIQNITLKIGNSHGFDPEKFSPKDEGGKIIFSENPVAEKKDDKR